MAKYFLNPLVWLRRFRKRCGYGVHSPYAFDFITGVLYERLPYYAYKELDKLHPTWVSALSLRPVKRMRMLFRVANFAHPRQACTIDATDLTKRYLQAAVPSAEWHESASQAAHFDFIYLSHPVEDILSFVHEGSVLVLDDLRHNLTAWKKLLADERTVLSFDLYDVGILMFDKRFNRMDYVVNF